MGISGDIHIAIWVNTGVDNLLNKSSKTGDYRAFNALSSLKDLETVNEITS